MKVKLLYIRLLYLSIKPAQISASFTNLSRLVKELMFRKSYRIFAFHLMSVPLKQNRFIDGQASCLLMISNFTVFVNYGLYSFQLLLCVVLIFSLVKKIISFNKVFNCFFFQGSFISVLFKTYRQPNSVQTIVTKAEILLTIIRQINYSTFKRVSY